MASDSVLFYTCADGAYEAFAPLFIASSLWSVPSALAEVGVENRARFIKDHARALAVLEQHLPGRFAISEVGFDRSKMIPNTVRFVTPPTLKAEYVYISDIDIIMLDQAFPAEHLKFMASHGLPYANSMRDRDMRMTGLHFTRHDAYYPIPELEPEILRINDEQVLAELVTRRGHSLHFTPWFRPVPGIHVSPNRAPQGERLSDGRRVPGWGIEPWVKPFRAFRDTALYKSLAPTLAGRAADALEAIEKVIDPKPAQDDSPDEAVAAKFTKIFSENSWKSTESISGTGSSHAATRELVPQLIELIDRRQIWNLIDAPCGDFNWVGPVAEHLGRYRGYDVVEGVVEQARARSHHQFEVGDITARVLPRADAIMSRDCLVHLPDDLVIQAIRNFVASGSIWLLTTHFPELAENKPGSLGGWRPLNLTLAPFNLPEPTEMLVERPSIPPHAVYGRKTLAAWRLEDLAAV